MSFLRAFFVAFVFFVAIFLRGITHYNERMRQHREATAALSGRARAWRWGAAALAVTLALACTPAPGSGESVPVPPAEAQAPASPIEIQTLTPATDSVGPVPTRFAWTAVEGASRYSIAVYNDVDRMLWQDEGVSGASVPKPAELELPAGTYFWRVAAIRDDKVLADSGWSAFVVRTE